MSRNRIMRLALGTVVVLSACEDAQGPQTAGTLDTEVAAVAAALVGDDVAALRGQGLAGFGPAGLMFPPIGPGMPPCGDATPCPEAHRDGLTHTRTVTFFDASGATQTAYDSLTTASIRFEMSAAGTMQRDDWTATVERERTLTVTGLEGVETQATWNGSGSSTMLRTRLEGDQERSLQISSTSQVDDVVVPRGAATRWPLSGSITQQHTITRDTGSGEVTEQRTAVITFDGTQYATLTVGAESFTVDLAGGRCLPGGRRPGMRR